MTTNQEAIKLLGNTIHACFAIAPIKQFLGGNNPRQAGESVWLFVR